MHSPVLTGPESGSVAHGSVLIRVPGQTACRSRPLHCPSDLARITFISRIAKLSSPPPFSSLSVSATRSSLEIGHLRHKVAASDFAGLFLPDALPYLWRRLPPLLESGTFGRDRFVLRARAHRQRTESGAPDHRRFSSTQSG